MIDNALTQPKMQHYDSQTQKSKVFKNGQPQQITPPVLKREIGAQKIRYNKNGFLHIKNLKSPLSNQKGQVNLTERLPPLSIKKDKIYANDKINKIQKISQYNSKQVQNKHTQTQKIDEEQDIKPYMISPKVLKKLSSIETAISNQTVNLVRPPSLLNNDCDYIDKSQIIFKKLDQNQIQKLLQIVAFWVTRSCYVRLIRIESTEQYLEQQQQYKCLVKIYGKMKLKFFSFLVTQYLQQFTLQKTIRQYGPCSQRFIKKAVKNIIKGLQIMHSKGHSFNILSPDKIYSNAEGQISIDTAKAKSTGRFTMEQKRKNFYFISPQLLVYGQNGFQNDTWSLGCVILVLILGINLKSSIQLHPYNQIQQLKYRDQKSNFMVKKLLSFKKQREQKYSSKSDKKSPISLYNKKNLDNKLFAENLRLQNIQQIQISQQLYNFVKECLKIKDRPMLCELLSHPFLMD